jgi:hypothetical protein
VLAEVHRYTAPQLERDAPEFGSPAYVDADDDGKGKAESRAALRWFGAGDTLDERAARADALDERAGAAAISRDMAEQRHPWDQRTHAEVVKARGEEPAAKVEPVREEKPAPTPTREEVEREPEPERPDTSWVREAQQAATREPAPEPKRDDLAAQVQRAQAAVERMQAEKVEAREAAPVQREHQVPVREDAER